MLHADNGSDDCQSSSENEDDEDELDLVARPKYTAHDDWRRKQSELVPHVIFVQRSRKIYDSTLRVNLFHEGHFSFIRDLNGFAKFFRCEKCNKLFNLKQNYEKHCTTCEKITKEVFPGGGWGRQMDLFTQIADEFGVVVPENDRFYRFLATFDFEARFSELNMVPQSSDPLLRGDSVVENPMGQSFFIFIGQQFLIIHLQIVFNNRCEKNTIFGAVDPSQRGDFC